MALRLIALLVTTALFFGLACGSGGQPSPASPSPVASPSPTPTLVASPSPLLREELPARDLQDLAIRFGLAPPDTPRSLPPREPLPLGIKQEFFLTDPLAPSVNSIRAELRLITEHAYFFLQESVSVAQSAMQQAGRNFEERVYPAVTSAFGQEWTPGVDGDPRMIILM
ncbi:MAG TPA: hypothetical protein VNL15_05310, partial [Dehalococcoidia bacterium]|nr:hypothetical protein [Dehalococcoidia bacterium]